MPAICPECGATCPPTTVGRPRRFCSRACKTKWHDRIRRADPKCRERHREHAARVHAARVLAGLCVDVGCQRRPLPGKTRCKKHLAALNARTREAKRKNREKARAAGLCVDCGQPAGGGYACPACREARNAAVRQARARR